MNNLAKAEYLYKTAASMSESGNYFVAEQIEKLADHHGRLFLKEALKDAKELQKQAVIEKPESSTTPHEGLKKRSCSSNRSKTSGWAKNIYDFAAKDNIASAAVRNLGRGAAIGVGTAVPVAAAAYYVAPSIARSAATEASEGAAEGFYDKFKQYAVPGALALGGIVAGAYSMSGGSDKKSPQAQRAPRGQAVLPRRKMAELISGCIVREKLASMSGEDSPEVSACETAIVRLLLRGK